MTKLAVSVLAALLVPVASCHAQSPAPACPLDEKHVGQQLTVGGTALSGPHDLYFQIDGCEEGVYLTYAGATDNTVSATLLRADATWRKFQKFTDSVYKTQPPDFCDACQKYGPTSAVLTAKLEIITPGAVRDSYGVLRDASGRRTLDSRLRSSSAAVSISIDHSFRRERNCPEDAQTFAAFVLTHTSALASADDIAYSRESQSERTRPEFHLYDNRVYRDFERTPGSRLSGMPCLHLALLLCSD